MNGMDYDSHGPTKGLGPTRPSVLGSLSDTRDRTWNPGNYINASCRMRVIDAASATGRDIFPDYMAVNVTYQ